MDAGDEYGTGRPPVDGYIVYTLLVLERGAKDRSSFGTFIESVYGVSWRTNDCMH